jgi:hypothetical protein
MVSTTITLIRSYLMIEVLTENICDWVGSATIHGWNTGRLFLHDGTLYFIANIKRPEGCDDSWKHDRGQVFSRPLGEGTWSECAVIDQRFYTGAVDADGRTWIIDPQEFNNVMLWRSRAGMDFSTIDRMYDGTCAYLGAGVSPDKSFLFIHAEATNHTARFPNALTTVFYDEPTRAYHVGRIPTPQGRFGYVGIILDGRKARVLTQSTQFDPIVEPVIPHYNWRLLKLLACDDLTKGEWKVQPLLDRDFGKTNQQDMMRCPDGSILIACNHQGSDISYEDGEAQPNEFHIARVADDLSFEIFKPGIQTEATKLFVDSKDQVYAVGRHGEKGLHLWRLDPNGGFKVLADWDLPGTEHMMSLLHTLRPERFGGQSDGDTIHMVSTDPAPGGFGTGAQELSPWYARFDLPVNE